MNFSNCRSMIYSPDLWSIRIWSVLSSSYHVVLIKYKKRMETETTYVWAVGNPQHLPASKTDLGQIYVKESLIQHNAILFSNLLAYLEKFKFKFMHTESVIFTEVIYFEYYPTGFSPGRIWPSHWLRIFRWCIMNLGC